MNNLRARFHSDGSELDEIVNSALVGKSVTTVRKDLTLDTQIDQLVFDVVNPRGLQALQQQGATRIVQITDETRAAIRRLLAEMTTAGVPAVQQAARIKQLIGLTEAHAQAVENLRADLTDQGIAPARIETLVQRKATQLLNLRALTIARTESVTAAALGQRESWEQAAAQGLFVKAEALQEWDTANDEQVCPICGPLDGQQVPYGQPFVSDDGETFDDPPAHPNCRCVANLVL